MDINFHLRINQQVPVLAGIVAAVMLTVSLPSMADKRILKWTDKNGIVHYGDTIPAQASGRSNTELNSQGITVKKTDAFARQKKDTHQAQSEQLRKDTALLASYSSVEEIDLAMERNVATEENLLKSFKLRLKHSKQSLDDALALKAAKISRNLTPSKYLNDKISSTRKKVEQTQANIIETENKIALIKQRFNSYKQRYAEVRPRNNTLSAIKYNARNITELEAWKRKANETLSYYLQETIKYKREGRKIPKDIVHNIQKTNREIARADQAIANIRASIRHSEEKFTSK